MASAVQVETGDQSTPHKPWLWQKGQSGNPAGIPAGGYPSLRKAARRFFKDNPEVLDQIIQTTAAIACDRNNPKFAVPAAHLLGRILGDFDVSVIEDEATQQKRLVVIKRAPDGTESIVEPNGNGNGNGHHPTPPATAG